MESATAGKAVERRSQSRRVRTTLYASANLSRHDFPRPGRQADEGGLLVLECLDAGEVRAGWPGGDGVVLRWWVSSGIKFRAALRRRELCGERHHRGQRQLPPGRFRVSLSSGADQGIDRKSTRLNSSHSQISYAVFCLKKKKKTHKLLYITH